MIRLIKVMVIVLLIAFLNESFLERREKKVEVIKILGTEKVPDYYAENIEIRQFDTQGKLQSLITAKLLSHYSDEGQANLEYPSLILATNEGGQTGVKSVAGAIFDMSHNMSLTDDVQLIAVDENEQQKLLLNTSQLNYTAVEHRLWTNKKIKANSIRSKFSATGFQMDLKSDQLSFDNNVQIHYSL